MTGDCPGVRLSIQARTAQSHMERSATPSCGRAALGLAKNVNMRRLKFFVARDVCFEDADTPPEPVITGNGSVHYVVCRISNARTHKGQQELWVEWKGYDQSQNCWVHRDVLMTDVPALVKAFDDRNRPWSFQARASAPKRATKGYKASVWGQVPLRRSARCVARSN